MLEWLENHLFKCSAFFFFILFLATLGLHAVCGLSLVAVRGLLISVASLVAEHGV